MLKKIFGVPLFLAFSLTLYGAAEYAPRNACGMVYYWDTNGTTWILLGRENRLESGGEGVVWYDFCGREDSKDNRDLYATALREANEETAGQLKLIKEDKPRSAELWTGPTYFIRAQDMVDPKVMKAARSSHRDVEKNDWRWVKAENLLSDVGTVEKGLGRFHSLFKGKLRTDHIKKPLQAIIDEGKKNAAIATPLAKKNTPAQKVSAAATAKPVVSKIDIEKTKKDGAALYDQLAVWEKQMGKVAERLSIEDRFIVQGVVGSLQQVLGRIEKLIGK